jgi:DNA repair protein RecO (recombination protein O)
VPSLYQTQGIVLHQIKYGDSSLIAKIYTESFGLQSYLFKGIRRATSKIKPTLLQHGTLVEMIVYHKTTGGLQHVKEIKNASHYQSIPFDIRKSSIVLFISEVLYRSLYEEESNPTLFSFLFESFRYLDMTGQPVANFHLIFMTKLMRYLGFFPQPKSSPSKQYFDMKEGHFTDHEPSHKQSIGPGLSDLFNSLLSANYEDLGKIHVPSTHRMELLNKILVYYSLHLPSFREIKSHLILHEVLD